MNHMGMNGGQMPNGMGGMAGMQPGANGAAQRPSDELDFKCRLNTYIYDYLLKNEQYDAARALLKGSLQLSVRPDGKKRPNGMGNDAMDQDSKENLDLNKPDDLPYPDKLIEACFDNSFLLDWFTLFFEVFMAPRTNRHHKLNPSAIQYMNNTREQARIANEQRQNMLRQPGMNPQMQQYRNMMQMGMQRNARMNPGVMNNLTPQQQQQVLQRQQMMAHQQQMERAGSEVDMNGAPRPRSPNNGMMQAGMDMQNPDFYNGQLARPGMPQAVNGQGGNHALQDYQMQLMLLEQQNKKRLLMARQEQDNLRPDQQGNMGGQQQPFAPGMSPQGSRSGPSPNPTEQMKRGTPKLNQSGLPGSPMPDGNIAGRGSPGAMNFNGTMPMEMMKAMNNMVGEGMQIGPNGVMRPPSSHPFNNAQLSQQQMEAMRAQAQNGRMPNGANWAQGPQGPPQMGNPQAGQVPGPVGAGTPQSRTAAMPPPQNPAAAANPNAQAGQNNQNMNNANANAGNNAANNANAANGRPASPAPSASATTPQTTNKANPAKKAKTEKERKRPTKKNTATGATPSAEGDNQPPTPQAPQTPATPLHKSFGDNKGGQTGPSNTQSVAPAPAQAAPVGQPQDNTSMMDQFSMEGGIDQNDLNMEFGGLENEDVLNQFDFDQFISHDTQEFDLSAFDSYPDMPTGNEV